MSRRIVALTVVAAVATPAVAAAATPSVRVSAAPITSSLSTKATRTSVAVKKRRASE